MINNGTKTGQINETGYNNISDKVFPNVDPYVNMINNTKGPFSFHFTLDLPDSENYKFY